MRTAEGEIIIMADMLDPATIKAQRMAELKDIAEYRARRLASIQAWSNSQAIAERKAKHEADAATALERGRRMASRALADQMSSCDLKMNKLPGIKLTPHTKPQIKKTWLQRLFFWR